MSTEDATRDPGESGEEGSDVDGHLLKESIAAGLAAAVIAAPAQAKPVPDPPDGHESVALVAASQQGVRSVEQKARKAKAERKRETQVPKGRHLE